MTTQQGTQTETTTWTIDANHSLIEFSVKHMMFTTVKGRFAGVQGRIHYNTVDPAKSTVEASIDAASIDTRAEQRDAHLKSADFFDVEKNPTISFRSTKVEIETPQRAKVTGDLSLHGVTKPVTLDVTLNGFGTNPYGQEVGGFTAETVVNRKDFGLNWNVALESGGVLVGEHINVILEVQAVKEG